MLRSLSLMCDTVRMTNKQISARRLAAEDATHRTYDRRDERQARARRRARAWREAARTPAPAPLNADVVDDLKRHGAQLARTRGGQLRVSLPAWGVDARTVELLHEVYG